MGYWQPTKPMRKAGFSQVACGLNGPDAWAKAEEWNRRWDKYRTTGEIRRWPTGSLGAAYDTFRATKTWAEKKPRTREDWERGWRYIAPVFGDTIANSVTLDLVDDWYAGIVKGAGVREAWRAMKIWRALWNIMKAMNIATIADPSKGVRRKTPIPRRLIWQEHEVVRLAKNALRRGYHGLACIIAVAWDAALSPVDARTLIFAQMRQDGPRIAFVIERAKTGQPAIATLSARASRLVRAYIASLPEGQLPSAVIFRHRGGLPYSKDTLGDDFRDIREPTENRQLLDMRRSAAVEALDGGASPAIISAKLANQLSTNEELKRTYLPVDIGIVRAADEARIESRRKNRKGQKVGTFQVSG
jgi:hypothetical protein